MQLIALAWLGRGDYTRNDFPQAIRDAQDARTDHTASYLLGIPLLPDYLEEALSQLGHSCESFELGRL